MEETAKQTARALIDLYAGFAASETQDAEDHALDTALMRLEEVGAFTAEVDDDDDDAVAIEITPLLIGSTITMQWLVAQLEKATGYSEAEIVFDLRLFIDSLSAD